MDPSILSAIIGGIAGLITGAIVSLIAPWITWGVEKKRKKQERREELVNQWREIIMKDGFSRKNLLNHPLYGPLRGLLSDDVRTDLERPSNHLVVVVNSPMDNHDRTIILREIARIEKLWELI
jgi:hypothetical protein